MGMKVNQCHVFFAWLSAFLRSVTHCCTFEIWRTTLWDRSKKARIDRFKENCTLNFCHLYPVLFFNYSYILVSKTEQNSHFSDLFKISSFDFSLGSPFDLIHLNLIVNWKVLNKGFFKKIVLNWVLFHGLIWRILKYHKDKNGFCLNNWTNIYGFVNIKNFKQSILLLK